MPAIDFTRLKRQVAELGEYFSQPGLFIRHLHELFYFYADRTMRTTPAGSRPPLLPHYTISAPVIRQLEMELAWRAEKADLHAALELVDALWNEGYFEFRLLAASLLGKLGPGVETEMIARLQAWAQPDEDRRLLNALFKAGKASLGKDNLDSWLKQITIWIDSNSVEICGLGLRALQTVIVDPQFENLPKVYKLLTPVAASAPVSLHPEIASLIEILARRSGAETVSFLKYILVVASSSNITRLVRRCLPYFDEESQKNLRTALAQKATQA